MAVTTSNAFRISIATTTAPAWVLNLPLWQWYSIPNTALANTPPSVTTYGNPNGKVTAWCGACLKRSGSVYMLGAAGGHDDYWGNEVNAITLNTANPAWSEVKAPTPQAYIYRDVCFYAEEPDGKNRPSPTHTYYATQFVNPLNRMVVVNSPGASGPTPPAAPGDYPYGSHSSGYSFVFNVASGDWEDPEWMAPYLGPAGDWTACFCVTHPTTGDIYYARGYTLYKWTASSGGGSWSQVTTSFWGATGYAAAALDTTRNRFLIVGAYNSESGGPRVYGTNGVNVSTTFGGLGASALTFHTGLGYYPGLVYDEANDTFLAVYNDTTIKVRRVNASTWNVDAPAVTGTAPTARTNGILNAVQYVPELKGIVIANAYGENLKFMRTAI